MAGGGAVFGAGVATHVVTVNASPAAVAGSEVPGELTAREHDVLTLVADGASNSEIARALGLSLKTVQNYVSRSLDQLQVADRTQAAIRTRRDQERHQR